MFVDQYIESARKNLEAIGKALLEGARRQAIPKEKALALKIQELGFEKKILFYLLLGKNWR